MADKTNGLENAPEGTLDDNVPPGKGEKIDLNEEEEAALDRAWERIRQRNALRRQRQEQQEQEE